VFDIITSILASLGGFGVFLLMLAENVFPPIPSEVILPLAGYTAAQGAARCGWWQSPAPSDRLQGRCCGTMSAAGSASND
jgi:hypothetical protein